MENKDILKELIHTMYEQRTTESLGDILNTVQESDVWIPCNTILSEADQKRLNSLAEQLADNGDPNDLIGETFTNQDPVRMIPDILKNGDFYFFPVFTNPEEMGEYGNNFSHVEKHFLEAAQLALNNEYNVTAIVVNPFTESLELPREFLEDALLNNREE